MMENYSRKLAGWMTVEVVKNDITEEKVEAIVNSSNSELRHEGGLGAALLRKGGDAIQRES